METSNQNNGMLVIAIKIDEKHSVWLLIFFLSVFAAGVFVVDVVALLVIS